MPTLLLLGLESRKHQTDFRSDRDAKMNGSSLAGTVLASRYKILETIDVDSFKAHDLTLDQTVTVRQALLTSQCDGNTWRQKVQRLALVRDPNFLNILDVVSDKSSYFVVTERPLCRSIAELLRERSRLDPEDVLALMTPLAGALDLAASFACCPNLISARWLFAEIRRSFAVESDERSLSELPPFFVKLDVWELVRPRKNITWPILTSKEQRGDSRSLALRQAALFTYELLGGETGKESEVKRWFKPVNGLGKAANSILYRGLQGSPLFESTGCFFHKLKSTIQSGDGGSGTHYSPAPQTREHSVVLPDTNDVLKRFDRNTDWLAALMVGAFVSAALMLAILVQERHPRAVGPTEDAVQAGGDLLLNTNAATLLKDVGLKGNRSTGETSGQASSVDHPFAEISPKENPSSQTDAAASPPTPVLAFTPEINRHDLQANAGSWTLAYRQDPGRAIGPKARNIRYRSSVMLRSVDVKRRLIELWHQSLAKSEKSRNWTAFSNLNRGVKKSRLHRRNEPLIEAASGMENLRSSSAMHRFTAILITLLPVVPASRQYSKARLFLNLGLRPPRLRFQASCEVRRKQPGYLTRTKLRDWYRRCDQNGPPARRDEEAYLNRYVTEEQRSRRPIFIATLRAARLSAGCSVAHRSKTTAGIVPLRFAHPAEKYAAAPLYQPRTWGSSHSTWEKHAPLDGSFGMSRNTIKCGATAKSV